jgi:hypothetical protein
VPRHHPQAPGHHFEVRRSRFAYRLEQRENILDDLKARSDRRRMMRGRLALTALRAQTAPHRLNPIEAHMRATRRRFTPRVALAIATLDHFAQRRRQGEVIADDVNVQERTSTDINAGPAAMPRDAFLVRPQPALHATPAHLAARVARASREPPARPRRVTAVGAPGKAWRRGIEVM